MSCSGNPGQTPTDTGTEEVCPETSSLSGGSPSSLNLRTPSSLEARIEALRTAINNAIDPQMEPQQSSGAPELLSHHQNSWERRRSIERPELLPTDTHASGVCHDTLSFSDRPQPPHLRLWGPWPPDRRGGTIRPFTGYATEPQRVSRISRLCRPHQNSWTRRRSIEHSELLHTDTHASGVRHDTSSFSNVAPPPHLRIWGQLPQDTHGRTIRPSTGYVAEPQQSSGSLGYCQYHQNSWTRSLSIEHLGLLSTDTHAPGVHHDTSSSSDGAPPPSLGLFGPSFQATHVATIGPATVYVTNPQTEAQQNPSALSFYRRHQHSCRRRRSIERPGLLPTDTHASGVRHGTLNFSGRPPPPHLRQWGPLPPDRHVRTIPPPTIYVRNPQTESQQDPSAPSYCRHNQNLWTRRHSTEHPGLLPTDTHASGVHHDTVSFSDRPPPPHLRLWGPLPPDRLIGTIRPPTIYVTNPLTEPQLSTTPPRHYRRNPNLWRRRRSTEHPEQLPTDTHASGVRHDTSSFSDGAPPAH